MGTVLGHARVSTGDPDASGQPLHRDGAGTRCVFEGVRAGDTLSAVRRNRRECSRNVQLKGRGINRFSLDAKTAARPAAGELITPGFGAIGQSERRQTAARTNNGVVVARTNYKRQTMLKLASDGPSPPVAALMISFGRAPVHCETAVAGCRMVA